MTKTINKMLKEDDELKYLVQITVYVRRLESTLNHLIKSNEKVLKVLRYLKERKIHPELITTSMLHQIMTDVKRTSENLDFAIPTEHLRIEEIIKISEIDAIYQDGRTIDVIHVPLVDREPYQIYRLHPVAVPQNVENQTTEIVFVKPSHKYIAINSNQERYVKFDVEPTIKCTKTHYALICPILGPFESTPTSKDCEVAMLLNPNTEILKTCDVRYGTSAKTQLKYLENDQSWLYSAVKPEQMRISCTNQRDTKIKLEKAAIIRLSPTCVGRTTDSMIFGQETKSSRTTYLYKPEIDLKIHDMYPILNEKDQNPGHDAP
ncbi:uncharacterized protein LOC103317678 [Nasonia vitripennis]|uniref:Envelope fusion protein n=1 Tax=Nasonia vitripennis TaxID=7425 RepID=A0A7M7LRW8_NASVI|nr:uncharacterized protein LOC103317678 [Nasonia vitripennis]